MCTISHNLVAFFTLVAMSNQRKWCGLSRAAAVPNFELWDPFTGALPHIVIINPDATPGYD